MPGDVEGLERRYEAHNVKLARRFFLAGLLCLPWLWITNLIYFRGALCSNEASPALKKWLVRSAWGVLVLTLAFGSWVVFIQTEWRALNLASVLAIVPSDGSDWWNDNS